jgi:hypothetical protein
MVPAWLVGLGVIGRISGAYTMAEMGAEFDVYYGRVKRAVRRFEHPIH